MAVRLGLGAIGLLMLLQQSPATAGECRAMWQAGRALHADLQRKAIEELNRKDHAAACETMHELTRLASAMRDFANQNCRANEAAKRSLAATDNIAIRTEEICAQAGR